MALNQMIAQGAQFNMPDPVAQYAKMQQLQAVQNQNSLAQYQLGSAQRGDMQQNALYARLQDPNFDQANPQHLASLSQFGTPGIQAMKAITEASNARQTGQKLEGENRGLQQKEIDQIARNLSQNPTDENIQASKDIIQKSSFYSPEAKTKALAAFDRALKIPLTERGSYFGMQGATAGDMMTARTAAAGRATTERGQDLTAKTAAAGQDVTIRGQDLTARTAAAGQDVTRRGQDLTAGTAVDRLKFEQDKFAWEKANPGYSIQDTSEGMVAVNLKNPSDVRQLTLGSTGIVSSTVHTAERDRASRELIASANRLSTAKTADNRLAFEKTKFNWEKANPGYSIQDSSTGLVAVNLKNPQDIRPISMGGQPLQSAVKAKDASVSEQNAAYNIGRVLTAASQINDIVKKDPSSVQPGGGEALASSVGLGGTANLTRNANRQIVYGAQRDALDALLYLATGAAYNKEQLEGQMIAYVPAFTDKPEAVAAKKTRMTNLIQSAKIRAGKAWTPEMDKAMTALTGSAAPAAAAGIAPPPGFKRD